MSYYDITFVLVFKTVLSLPITIIKLSLVNTCGLLSHGLACRDYKNNSIFVMYFWYLRH